MVILYLFWDAIIVYIKILHIILCQHIHVMHCTDCSEKRHIFDDMHFVSMLKFLMVFGSKCFQRFAYKLQANYPARVKQLHMYNMGAVADLLMTITKFCLPEKMQQRVS